MIINPRAINKVTFAIDPHGQITTPFPHAKQTLTTGSFHHLFLISAADYKQHQC